MENINHTTGQSSDLKRRTFGLEIEFIGLTPKTISMVATEYASKLLQQQISLPCNNKCKQGSHKWYLPVDEKVANGKAPTCSTFSAWQVQTDVSISLADDEYQTYLSVADYTNIAQVELVSRVLDLDQPTPCPRGQLYRCTGELFSWSWRDELQSFLDVLRTGFAEPGYRMLVNKSTGIHIHFGNGRFGIPIDTVKGMLGGFTAFERCFDSIMPSVTEAMAGYTDRLVEEQLVESAPTVWLAPGEIDSQEKPSRDVVSDTEEWEKIQSSEWLQETTEHLTQEPWSQATEDPAQEARGQEPHEEWAPTVSSFWPQSKDQQPDDEPSWYTPLLLSRVPTDPAKVALNIHSLLLSHNIPGYLSHIRSLETIDDVKNIGTPHKTSLNLEHWSFPIPDITKNTIEIRMHFGNLCPMEISSWIDLLGSLMQCIETQGLQTWFAYCREKCADPKYSLVDLCRYIDCSADTIQHYDDVLHSGEYAERRYKKYTTGVFNPEDHLYPLTLNIESNRLVSSSISAVRQRQQQKLESGRYGQFPLSYLQVHVPEASTHVYAVGALNIDASQEEYLKRALEECSVEFPGHPAFNPLEIVDLRDDFEGVRIS